MPTILIEGPYRFFFSAADRDVPPHVHVERDNCVAKFWLEPVRLQNSRGYSRAELIRVRRLVEQNDFGFLEAWHEHFDD